MSDLKDTNPKDAAASGRVPMHMVPDTLSLYAAMGFAEGDSKYIAYNFRVAGVRASVYISALRRHFMKYVNGEWADVKTRVPHLASVASCLAILIDGHVGGTIVDDRPPAIDLNDEMARAEEIIAHVYALNKDKRPIGVEYTISNTAPAETPLPTIDPSLLDPPLPVIDPSLLPVGEVRELRWVCDDVASQFAAGAEARS